MKTPLLLLTLMLASAVQAAAQNTCTITGHISRNDGTANTAATVKVVSCSGGADGDFIADTPHDKPTDSLGNFSFPLLKGADCYIYSKDIKDFKREGGVLIHVPADRDTATLKSLPRVPAPPGQVAVVVTAPVVSSNGVVVDQAVDHFNFSSGFGVNRDSANHVTITNTSVGGVSSFNGRTGPITPTIGDYSAVQISGLQAAISANSDVAANTSARHTHANKTFLDSLAALTEGSIPFINSLGGFAQNNGALFWNDSAKRLLVHGNLLVSPPAAPTGLQGTLVFDPDTMPSYLDDDAVHNLRVYAYKLVSGVKYISESYATLGSNLSGNNTQTTRYQINWTWNAVTGADGYRIMIHDPNYVTSGFIAGVDVGTNAWTENGSESVSGLALTPNFKYDSPAHFFGATEFSGGANFDTLSVDHIDGLFKIRRDGSGTAFQPGLYFENTTATVDGETQNPPTYEFRGSRNGTVYRWRIIPNLNNNDDNGDPDPLLLIRRSVNNQSGGTDVMKIHWNGLVEFNSNIKAGNLNVGDAQYGQDELSLFTGGGFLGSTTVRTNGALMIDAHGLTLPLLTGETNPDTSEPLKDAVLMTIDHATQVIDFQVTNTQTSEVTHYRLALNGQLIVESSTDPTTADIADGQCVDWHNSSGDTLKRVCNVGGALKSITYN